MRISGDRPSSSAVMLRDALFNRRDFAAAEQYFSPTYLQHSAVIAAGRDGLFSLVRGLTRRYESALVVAEGDYVMVHGRFSGGGRPTRIVVDIFRIEGARLADHWDVVQDEGTKAESRRGLANLGATFPYCAQEASRGVRRVGQIRT